MKKHLTLFRRVVLQLCLFIAATSTAQAPSMGADNFSPAVAGSRSAPGSGPVVASAGRPYIGYEKPENDFKDIRKAVAPYSNHPGNHYNPDGTLDNYTECGTPPPAAPTVSLGNALHFDGTNDFVQTGFSPVSISNNFTVEAWVKPENTTEDLTIVSTRSNEYSFDVKLRGGNQIHSDIGNGFFWINTSADATYYYTPGQWVHIAFVVTPDSYTIYANGIALNSGSLSGGPLFINNSRKLIIGAVSPSGEFFEGSIDEVKIYNTALTASQVLYDMVNTGAVLPANIQFYYNFNNGTAGGNNTTATSLTDGGSNYNGDLNNFTLTGGTSNWITSNALSKQTLCYGATVASLTATGTGLKWYNVASGGTPLASGTTVSVGTYYVSQTLNSCESARTLVYANTNSPNAPTAPTVSSGNALHFDGSDDYVQTGFSSANINGSFTVEAWVKPENTTGTLTIVSTRHPSDYTFDLKLVGGNQIHADIGNGGYWLTSAADASYNYTPNQWLHIAFVVTPGNYTIYANGLPVQTNTYSGTALFINDERRLYIGALNPLIEFFAGSIDEVKIYNTALTQAQVQTDMLNTGAVLPGNIQYYYNFDNGTANGNNTTATTLTDLGGTSYNGTLNGFALTGSASNWLTSNTVAAQTLCSGATVANLAATGTALKWYNVASGGSPLAAATVLSPGIYYVSETQSSCESARMSVNVTINTTTPPTASAQTFCNGATVANLTATGTALKWYTASTGGSALASNTALATGTYYVSQTLNSCESTRTAVAVTINTTAAPTASAQAFCNSATVANLTATGTTLKWYNVASGGSALTSATAVATGTYYVSQTLNSCESARTAVTVTVSTTSAPTASAQAFCNSATVANLSATGTALKWYNVASGGSALASATALATGTYYVSQTLNSCESTRTAVTVTVNTTAAPTASAQTFCNSAT
ncbi:LamG-like jellyroll fold domain-containing protein, partial [Flavobacterium sp. RHBU_24]|uniref:LamG-like jellyroll fold domain-containing protein n=1 Tax=Flavobacterium sp. RHBU_24 TaxID=3391185 RepID=UPI0039853D23